MCDWGYVSAKDRVLSNRDVLLFLQVSTNAIVCPYLGKTVGHTMTTMTLVELTGGMEPGSGSQDGVYEILPVPQTTH